MPCDVKSTPEVIINQIVNTRCDYVKTFLEIAKGNTKTKDNTEKDKTKMVVNSSTSAPRQKLLTQCLRSQLQSLHCHVCMYRVATSVLIHVDEFRVNFSLTYFYFVFNSFDLCICEHLSIEHVLLIINWRISFRENGYVHHKFAMKITKSIAFHQHDNECLYTHGYF